MVRTSKTHPLEIATIELENCKVGLSLCPGKKQEFPISGEPWDRCLNTDLELISNAGFDIVVTLIEEHEFVELEVEELTDTKTSEYGMSWIWAPIKDVKTPLPDIASELNSIIESLEDGHSVFIHCKGGLGRAGSVVAWLLTHHGFSSSDAISKVREVRPGAIETRLQENWVNKWSGHRMEENE